jgi:hypothetical protein
MRWNRKSWFMGMKGLGRRRRRKKREIPLIERE